jgi:uncharacterized Zn finger protein
MKSNYARLSNECAQCGSTLTAPEWTEYRGERCIRHLWACDACGYVYETIVYLKPRARAFNARRMVQDSDHYDHA